jgi:hypothetical protein
MTTDDKVSQDTVNAASEGIRTEPPPFEPGYQPGSVPEITVPDLAEDAVGVSAEVLAEAAIPTLTDQVVPVPDENEVALVENPDDAQVAIQSEEALPAQEPEVQVDTWHEQIQVRMTKLLGEIQILNDRLDRLEQRAKDKR